MSIYAPDPKTRQPFRLVLFGFLFVTAIAAGFLGTALALGTEPRMLLERSEDGSFRVTGSSFFSGYQYFSKTIAGVTKVEVGSAARDWHNDSLREKQWQKNQKHLDLYGADRARLGWDREGDQTQIEAFMRGTEPTLSLTDPPQLWRMSIAWFAAGFGVLVFIGGMKNAFPKKR